jgi:HK97 family phage prohead protease
MRNKILHVGSVFKAIDEEDDDLIIHGMASTDDKDRVGDVISPMAWKNGLEHYKLNPIILFNHDYNRPIGRAVVVNQVEKGLELKAKISKAAGDIAGLIKDGVLGAFSVGFMVRDADYDSNTETFLIKQAELLEVSVVSVPANQAATFSVQKSFNSEDEYKEFISTFKSVNLASGQPLADKSNDALASATPEGQTVANSQEIKMDPKDIQTMIAEAVKGVSKDVATQIAMQRAEEKAAEEAARKAAEEVARKETAQKEAIVSVVKSNAEELVKDLTARFAEKEANFEKIIGEFRSELTERS